MRAASRTLKQEKETDAMNGEKSHPKRTGALVLWGVVALLGAGIALLAIWPKPGEPPIEVEEPFAAVRTVIVGEIAAVDALHLPGRIQPVNDLVVSAEKAGRIVELAVDRGDAVSAGQALFRIDDRLARAALARGEIERRDARRDLDRTERLRATGSVSDSDFDAARQRLDQATVALDEARVHLSQHESRSPFDGVVDDRTAEENEFVAEGRAVLRLVSRDRLKIAASVPERDIRFVEPGQAMTFTATTLGDQVYTGRVTFVAAAADPAGHAFPIEMVVPAPSPAAPLRAGMVVDVLLDRGPWTGGVAVPLVAIVPRKGEHLAFVVREGRAAARVVRIDRIAGVHVLVTAGLEAGEELVVEGQRSLQDGMRVVVNGE
jgi:membrane fusion protein (multidrug efflux system)